MALTTRRGQKAERKEQKTEILKAESISVILVSGFPSLALRQLSVIRQEQRAKGEAVRAEDGGQMTGFKTTRPRTTDHETTDWRNVEH
jgi:hypothetical protein